jgi:hypothetical protein
MAMLPAMAVTSGIIRGLARPEDRFVPSHDRALPRPGKDGTAPHLANTLFGFILKTSGRHQLALAAITILLCLVITLPLELQRRIVNDALQRRDFRTIGVLALAYFAAVIVQRSIKLAMNVYRSWVSESSTRYLRSTVLGSDRKAGNKKSGSQRGVDISIVLAEADPIGSFVGASVSEPLLSEPAGYDLPGFPVGPLSAHDDNDPFERWEAAGSTDAATRANSRWKKGAGRVSGAPTRQGYRRGSAIFVQRSLRRTYPDRRSFFDTPSKTT